MIDKASNVSFWVMAASLTSANSKLRV